jgi:hypothetical protein
LQTISTVAAIAIPWIAVVVIAIGTMTCGAALLTVGARNRLHLPPPGPLGAGGGDGEPILPIRRPPELPAPRRERG